ncbi:MAG: hypothetical protein K2X93_19390 [Candidatus Obscuribacterales bacterium]|nr:hypothetical protein [Candidatus Obscuribacterales bacterium]
MVSDAARGLPDLPSENQQQDQTSAAHLEVYSFNAPRGGASRDSDDNGSSSSTKPKWGSRTEDSDTSESDQEKLLLGLQGTAGLYPQAEGPRYASLTGGGTEAHTSPERLSGSEVARGKGLATEDNPVVGREPLPGAGLEQPGTSPVGGDSVSGYIDQPKPVEPRKFDGFGRRTATEVDVTGVGKVGVSATRDSNNQVNKIDLRIGNDTISYTRFADGIWNRAAGKPGEKQPSAESLKGAEKALKSLGIESVGMTGRMFKGDLDLTADGKVRYQSSDAPDKKISFMSPDGTVTKFNFENYTRETVGKDGRSSLDGWDGKKFVPARDATREVLADGSVKTTVTLDGSHNRSIERITNPGKLGTGEGKRDETSFNPKTGDSSTYSWLSGTQTIKGKTSYLDGTTGRYREGAVSGNTVTFTDKDPSSKVTSAARDTKTGITTYRGPGGYEVTKSLENNAVLTTKTDAGQFTFSGNKKDPHTIDRFTLNGKTYTRVGENKDGTINADIARGTRTLKDYQPRSTSDLNEYKDEKGQKFRMSVVVDQDGRVKTAVPGKDGKPLVREYPPTSTVKDSPPGAAKPDLDGRQRELFDKPKESTPAEKAKQKDELKATKFDREGNPTQYQFGKGNLKLSRNGDGSWSHSKLNEDKPFKPPSEFAKNIYTNRDLTAEQKERIVDNAKKFDSMENFTDKQKQEVYKQAARLLDGKDAALTSREKAELADQLFWHIANSADNNQGRNNTCNVTVLRGMALKDQPEVAAKLSADVANTGKYATKNGTTINVPMDSVKVRPGSPESKFPPDAGSRTALGKLWDVSLINGRLQRTTFDPTGQKVAKGSLSYREVTPESRTDTGGRIVRKNDDGSESVLHINKNGVSKPNDSPLIGGSAIADAWNQITGDKLEGRYLMHEKLGGGGKEFERLVGGRITSEEQLRESLAKLGDKSAIVQLNTGRLQQMASQRAAVARGEDPNKVPRPEGGSHVVLVSDYDPKTGTMKIDNSWGQNNDVRMTLTELYDSMQTSSKGSGGKLEWYTPPKKK